MVRRTLGQPVLFAIIYTIVAAALYFSLGVVTERALGLTPLVYLIAGVFFLLAAMTYVEGASLHQDRAGATVFARYAFNELVSFVAGWVMLLDYVILLSVTAFTATHYLAAFWAPLGRGALETVVALAILAWVAWRSIRGFAKSRVQRIAALVIVDVVLQALVVVVGLAVFFDADLLTREIQLGSNPRWEDVLFAIGVATVVFTGLESASGLSGELQVGRRGLQRLIASATVSVLVLYVGIAVVAMTALPVIGNETSLARNYLEAPMVGIAEAFQPHWYADPLKYALAAAAAATLIAAAGSAMLGLSRLAYALATNRQIPSVLGRLHPRRSTPFVVICLAAVIAGALTVPNDLEFLVGLYAFGGLLGLTIAHVSIIVLRYREPTRKRPYRMPLSVRVGGGDLPIPAVLGAVLAVLAWLSVVFTHSGARWVGFGWLGFGVAMYVAYRLTQGKPLLRRVLVPEKALRGERHEVEYGSILVPIFGTPLDDDIIQTAGRLAAEEDAESFEEDHGATIEALWVFEVPMSLPIDAALPDEQLKRARAALARAKAVGEEYEGVEVATATVRARRAGQAIVDEARRRGVQAVVLAAEEPSKIRGGALLGGRGGPLDNFVGDVTKYVISKATCQVILTAPPAGESSRGRAAPPPAEGPPAAAAAAAAGRSAREAGNGRAGGRWSGRRAR
ncbi:MAG: basic amino acid/polyamine antiporter, family [Solirubrobacteraceae bacterium]|nr:basic amino acid/polyamine antiporter, family [Solirubrobacteraceae bacterium]